MALFLNHKDKKNNDKIALLLILDLLEIRYNASVN